MIKKCILPVAGYGSRFLPITKVKPKEMLPIGNKPLIQYSINEAYLANIQEFGMIISKHKYSIKQYFEANREIEEILKSTNKNELLIEINNLIDSCKFTYIEQSSMKGLGDAIYHGKSFVGNEAFAVILPDDLCHNNGLSVIEQMLEVYRRFPNKCVIAVEEVSELNISAYGIIKGTKIEGYENLFNVENLIEKPKIIDAPSNLAVIGRYILLPEIFLKIQNLSKGKGGEIQITDALAELAMEDKVIALKFEGKRYDCGNVKGYLEAISSLL